MSEPEYICLSCERTLQEWELWACQACHEPLCPICGGEVSTIEEYDEAMRVNSKEK